jgi:CubicO group peptidase (beta-lactamase class C family)
MSLTLPLALAALLLTPPAAPAAPATPAAPTTPTGATAPADLAPLLESIRLETGVPALGALLVTGKGTTRIEAIGVVGNRGGEPNLPVTAEDLWHLGSCTKAFTATLAAVLVDAGALRWETTVGELLGADMPSMHEGWRDVRLDELLRHRGGAPGSPAPEAWQEAWTCGEGAQPCRVRFVNAVLANKPNRARGEFEYSNQGYAIAGRMCEIAGKASWEDLVRDRVCAPLGITSLGFGVPSARQPERATRGHREGGVLTDIDNPAAIAPAGTMHMTLSDWARFVAAHLDPAGLKPLGVSEASFAVLHEAPATEPRSAMGWFAAERPWGGSVLTHAGSNTNWMCVAWLAPSRGFAVLTVSNAGGKGATKATDLAAAATIQWHIERSKPQDAAAPR